MPDHPNDELAACIKAALRASDEFQDVIVIDEGDGPVVKGYCDSFGHNFILILEGE